LSVIGPGLLVAATGVGAGDLLTASIAGSRAGLAVLWAALAGGLLKWTLNEGIARWQLATGTSLLAGWARYLPRWVPWVFGAYFLLWTLMVGGALVNACGVAATALLPLGDPGTSKIIWGILHSAAGFLLVRIGGFQLFERAMSSAVALLFGGVVLTAALLVPDWGAVAAGALVPALSFDALPWTLALIGGVGGTVTLLSYGYWIREAGRAGEAGVRTCRIDLAVAYTMTAVFGMAMVIVGTRIHVEGQGIGIALSLADQMGLILGPVGRWAFLIGFWSAVFSSLLGVWQSAPYLFADVRRGCRDDRSDRSDRDGVELSATRAYRGYLIVVAVAPLPLLWFSVTQVQLAYAVLGALFMPFLALTLLLLNTRADLVGARFTNSAPINAVLVAIVLLFLAMGGLQLAGWMPSTGG
jgi:Mn2+/Fe2+ NRAMP family transporter